MVNDLSSEEIKNSVEYQWRKYQIGMLLSVWLFIVVVTLFLPFIVIAINDHDLELLGYGMLIWLCCMAFIGLILGGFILFYCLKNRYLLKNYKNFNCYEVVLDNLSTSYSYSHSIYYTVNIVEEGITKKVDTNPYFSSSLFSKFYPVDFNNKKVIGLYDSNMEKFYIVKKVN